MPQHFFEIRFSRYSSQQSRRLSLSQKSQKNRYETRTRKKMSAARRSYCDEAGVKQSIKRNQTQHKKKFCLLFAHNTYIYIQDCDLRHYLTCLK